MSKVPDIIPVTEGKQGEYAYGGMFNGVDPPHEMEGFFFHKPLNGRLYFNPETNGFEGLGRKIKCECPHEFLTGKGPFFKTGHLFRYLHSAFPNQKLALWPAAMDVDNLSLFFCQDAGEIIEVRLDRDDVSLFQD